MTTADDPVGRAKALSASGRPEEALAVLAAATGAVDAPWPALAAHAALLKAMGDVDGALELARRAALAHPSSAIQSHNLASLAGDADLNPEAEAAARRALALGGDWPETWLVLARSLQGQNRFDEAQAAYRTAIARRPDYADALRDLSQLVWMQTGDLGAALVDLDIALAAQPSLARVKARLMAYAGDPRAAYAVMDAGPPDPSHHLEAARLALQFDPIRAFSHAQAAVQAGEDSAGALLTLAECHMALDRPEQALALIDRLARDRPYDQYRLALKAQTLRMLGDPAYRDLYDYGAMVGAALIDTPAGWLDLETYLVDLAQALARLHGLETHPVGQSLRHGTQTTADLTRSEDPAIRAFFAAVDAPIRRYIAGLGPGSDPLRSRRTGDYRLMGCWSVRLGPNGFHADHIHSQGWLSSACYISLPEAVAGPGHEGWIRFGQSAVAPLKPEHFVRPEPGLLVLFPSYMWHGTVPFTGQDHRLTIAFDVVPA